MGFSALRIALLFSSIAVAFAILITPMIDQGDRHSSVRGLAAGVDTITTSGIRGNSNRYIIRRSVLQDSPNDICIIREDGSASGKC